MSYGFVYITTNILNNKRYVGKRVIKNNKYDLSYLGSGVILRNAIAKEGKDKFIRDILVYCDNEKQLREAEERLIKKYNTRYPNGYNIAEKANGGDNISCHPNKREFTERSAEKRKGIKFPQERNDAISKKLTGLKRSKQARLNNSIAQKNPEVNRRKVESRYRNNNGIWHTEETKKKISAKKINIPKSEEWKQNHSKKLKGRPRPAKEIARMKNFMLSGANKVPCEYCGRLLNKNNYKQHTNKCQLKPK